MNIEFIGRRNYVTSKWSGGTTTQLFIYPENSRYKTGDFLFRISTAEILQENSEFTYLPNVSRMLTVLDKKMVFEINGEKVYLFPFDTLSFSGTDKVSAYGKCRDFNVMTKGCCAAAQRNFTFIDQVAVEALQPADFLFIYTAYGKISLNGVTASEGEMMKISAISINDHVRIQNLLYNKSQIIAVSIALEKGLEHYDNQSASNK